MKLLEDILNDILLNESVSVNDVESAIDNHNRIIINYHSKGENNNTGARVIEVYAYGLTKAGNPVIRCFQPYGDTTTRVPSWKFFRLDRISAWKPTEQTFSRPADFYYSGLGEFNPNGDETMSVVYKIAQFGDTATPPTSDSENSRPKTNDDVFRTETEKRMERFRQQLAHPIKLDDIKKDDAFKQIEPQSQYSQEEGPKTNADINRTNSETETEKQQTQTERPYDEEKEKELDALRQALSGKPITLADLAQKMKEYEEEQKKEQRNMRRRDRRWQKAADTRYLSRKGSLNREELD